MYFNFQPTHSFTAASKYRQSIPYPPVAMHKVSNHGKMSFLSIAYFSRFGSRKSEESLSSPRFVFFSRPQHGSWHTTGSRKLHPIAKSRVSQLIVLMLSANSALGAIALTGTQSSYSPFIEKPNGTTPSTILCQCLMTAGWACELACKRLCASAWIAAQVSLLIIFSNFTPYCG